MNFVRGEEHKRSAPEGDTEMETSSSAAESSMLIIGDEVSFTRQKVAEFLSSHTVYELVPDSGKVIVLDTQLRIQTAFHALYEQVSNTRTREREIKTLEVFERYEGGEIILTCTLFKRISREYLRHLCGTL